METISVIVPIYNVEKYLERCIESIINQTYKELEIILVDDGATDSSGAICDKYAEIDRRIKVIHKENGGLSDARNSGLDKATGEYVGFVDSDDWIDIDYYEKLIEIMHAYSVDIVSSLYRKVKTRKMAKKKKHNIKVLNGEQVLIYYLESAIKGGVTHVPCWSKLYKKSILNNNRFQKGKNYEDIMFNWEVINQSISCAYSDYVGYNYFINPESITRKKFNKKMYDLYYVTDYIQEKYKGSNAKITKLLSQYSARMDFSILVKMISSRYGNKMEIFNLKNNVKKNYKCLMKSPMSICRKLVLTGVLILPICEGRKEK